MQALFVDTHKRDIRVSTVSTTAAPTGHVMRFGSDIGAFWELTKEGEITIDLPLLIGSGGYSAQSSAGFVKVLPPTSRWEDPTTSLYVVGVQGFPWMKGSRALRALGAPIRALMVAPGATIRKVETQANRGPGGRGWQSNPEAAQAALAGFAIRAKVRPNSLHVLEGQSDYTQGWEITCPDFEESFPPFQEEHRPERFSLAELVSSAVRSAARRSDRATGETGEKGLQFLFLNLLLANEEKWGAELLSPPLSYYIGDDDLDEAIRPLVETMTAEGWSLGTDDDEGRLSVVSPAGDKATGSWLV